MAKLYRIHEFAERAGVTPKALRHYERLGLLKPARSASGYRLYSKSDRMRIDQIVTLKFLGIPLREIRALLDHPEPSLPEALRRQRVRLEERQRLLTRAIRAIEDAERTLDPDSSLSALWKKIVEVVAMQSDSEAMKNYYSEEAWAKRLQYYEQWPPAEFDDLFREISAALEEDPGGEKAQELKKRWIQVLNPRVTGDPEVQEGALTAWNDREHWPRFVESESAGIEGRASRRFSGPRSVRELEKIHHIRRMDEAARKPALPDRAVESVGPPDTDGARRRSGWRERTSGGPARDGAVDGRSLPWPMCL